MKADLLIHSARQLCVIPPHDGGSQRGHRLGDLGLIEDGAVACAEARIVAVGPTAEIRADWQSPVEIDASGHVVCPGFVDPHTHVVWAGDRAGEFVQRIQGATYQELQARGGGIMATVRATRAAPLDQLLAESRARLDRMLAHGTTTVEVKTGYGLTVEDELRLLDAIAILDADHPITLVPTFLGAHAVPAEFKDDSEAYVDLVVQEMLPAAAKCLASRHLHNRDLDQMGQDSATPNLAGGSFGGAQRWRNCMPFARSVKGPSLSFCDVFCDQGAFTLEQSRRVLEAAQALGFQLKIHADEFRPLGGTALAVELGAASADHLVCTPREEIEQLGRSDTVAVALPATPFGLGHQAYTSARDILAAGGTLALATDCNPGTAWCESMPFVIALACRTMHLTPAQALVAATLNSAFAVGLGDRVGSLEPGYGADILILDLPDVHHLGYRFGSNPVWQVVKQGRLVHTSLTESRGDRGQRS